MDLHANAKLGLAGRRALVLAIEGGLSLKRAAAALQRVAGDRASLVASLADGRSRSSASLVDRSSRPLRQPRRLSAGRGGSRSCGRGGRPTSGRAGWPGSCGGPARRSGRCSPGTGCRGGRAGSGRAIRRYEWSRPGALLHMDVKKLARFSVPGHRATGDRSTKTATAASATTTCTASSTTTAASPTSSCTPARTPTPTRARSSARLRFFAELGLDPPEAVMTDNAFVYTQQPPLPRAARRQPASGTSAPRPTHRAGTAKSNASSTHSRTNGPTAAPGPTHTTRARSPAKLHPLLQPQTPAQLTRRPATHQPRSQRLWAGQLAEPNPVHEERPRSRRVWRGPGQLAGPFHVPGSDLIPAELPFFLGKAIDDLGEDPARRWAAERAGNS